MTDSTHVAIVHRWFDDLFTAGDLTVLNELVSPDFVACDPSGHRASDLESWKRWFAWYRATFTEPEWMVHEVVSEADKAVVRYSGTVTYRGGWLDIPATDQRVTEMGILIFTIEDGKIRKLHTALSDLELAIALGAVVVPPEHVRPDTDLAPDR